MQRKTNTLLAVLGSSLASILFSTILLNSSAFAYSASITTSGSVALDVLSNDTSITPDSINISSDCRAGYNLVIATPNGNDYFYKYNGYSVRCVSGS